MTRDQLKKLEKDLWAAADKLRASIRERMKLEGIIVTL